MRQWVVLPLVLAAPVAAHAQGERASCATTRDCRGDDHCIDGACRPIDWVAPKPRSYGRDVAIADFIAVATLGTFSVFSGPIVHLVHRRPAMAAASFGLRVFGIALSAGSGVLVALALPPQAFNGQGCMGCPPSPNYLPQMFAGMLVGAGVGWIVASILDATLLARVW
jgi:hypothetical protein